MKMRQAWNKGKKEKKKTLPQNLDRKSSKNTSTFTNISGLQLKYGLSAKPESVIL
jgi:hypothetical protein